MAEIWLLIALATSGAHTTYAPATIGPFKTTDDCLAAAKVVKAAYESKSLTPGAVSSANTSCVTLMR